MSAGLNESLPNAVTGSAGPQALHIEALWWVMLLVCALVFAAVMALLAASLLRRREPHTPGPPVQGDQRGALRWIAGGAGLTAVILVGLVIASALVDRRLVAIETPGAMTVTITAQQWWWDVRYESSTPSEIVVTANEIHVPVGQPVLLRLKSQDVIHSFWVPSLAGKMDLIPGRDTSLWIQADREGVFQGQCAEFCGHQHAHMRFLVVAQPAGEFHKWLGRQRGLAREPATPEQKRGREIFLRTSCLMCHSIRGTPAGSRAGPDLTHLASRRTLAAATLPNTVEHLRDWIVDPQRIKPGTRMPSQTIPPDDLQALLAYLTSLE